MKPFIKCNILLLLFIGMLSYSFVSINAQTIEPHSKETYSIDTPYIYPITPENYKWLSLETHTEKLNACQIPENILSNMTTHALLQTVLNYPLMADMLAYDTPIEGYESIYNTFNGLRELSTRNDLSYEIIQLNAEKLSQYSLSEVSANSNLCSLYLKIISDYKYQKLTVLPSTQSLTAKVVYLKTPKGSSVVAINNQPWADTNYGSYAVAQSAEKEYRKLYPNATKIRNMSSTYNCHSYAWYSTSSSNMNWINDPTPYMKDGSYTKQSSPKIGDKFYRIATNGKPLHSGIIITLSFGAANKIGVRSKWGALGVYEHGLYDGPYGDNAKETTYWR